MTKATSLAWAAQNLIDICRVPSFIELGVNEWRADRIDCLRRVTHAFRCDQLVAVRSSSAREDTFESTNAGRYLSRLNVNPANQSEIEYAIDEVVASMDEVGSEAENDSVIVQEMVLDVALSGAATTWNVRTGAPYFVITFESNGDTSAVTSGRVTPQHVELRHRAPTELLPPKLRPLVSLLYYLLTDRPATPVEIEFAIQADLTVNLLQVRELRGIHVSLHGEAEEFILAKADVERLLEGAPNCLSDMSDWNPAEMIGEAPRDLAFSLYRELITSASWRIARRRFGYFSEAGKELMHRIGARPYIDVRASLSSLTPAIVDAGARGRLVDMNIESIKGDETSHRRIEFDIAISCVGFATRHRLSQRYADVLSEIELEAYYDAIRELTMNAIAGSSAIALDSIEARLRRLDRCMDTMTSEPVDHKWLDLNVLHTTGRPLAIEFAMSARHAFIAESILRDLIDNDVVTEQEVGLFRQSVRTIAHSFIVDAERLLSGDYEEGSFRRRYGHLRPGTYDIRSLPYALYSFQEVFRGFRRDASTVTYSLLPPTRERMLSALSMVELPVSPGLLFSYIQKAIRLREYGKFIYSRFVSLMLEDAASLGSRLGLTRDEISYLPIAEIRHQLTAGRDVRAFSELVRRSRERYEARARVTTPSFMSKTDDLLLARGDITRISFIGMGRIRAANVAIDDLTQPTSAVAGCIVCVERADPGYDWLLAAGVLGIVTRYGGPNAHLAVRCAELAIPAAIGCGEALFRRLVVSKWIEIDCGSGIVRPASYQP